MVFELFSTWYILPAGRDVLEDYFASAVLRRDHRKSMLITHEAMTHVSLKFVCATSASLRHPARAMVRKLEVVVAASGEVKAMNRHARALGVRLPMSARRNR